MLVFNFRLKMANEQGCATATFCVTYKEKTKLMTSSVSSDEVFQNLWVKIAQKFKLETDEYLVKLKVDKFNSYVDIDPEDPEDVELLRNGGAILVEPACLSPQGSSTTSQLNQSPERLPTSPARRLEPHSLFTTPSSDKNVDELTKSPLSGVGTSGPQSQRTHASPSGKPKVMNSYN